MHSPSHIEVKFDVGHIRRDQHNKLPLTMGADGYLPLGNDLADTNAENLEGFTLRQRSNPKSRLVPTIVLSILCLVEAVALVLLTQNSNIECLPSTVLFQDTDGFSNATTEAEIDSAWSIYGLREKIPSRSIGSDSSGPAN